MLVVTAAIFLWVPPYEGLGNVGRIVMVHVPTAWLTMLAFAVAAWQSIRYLRKHNPVFDDRAVAATELGFLFAVLATATGSMFAKVVWGSFWNWDPRETSILILLLVYGAYFALRSAIDDVERRRQLAAVYALFAFATAPLLIFVVPRLFESTLHPNCAFLKDSKCDGVVLAKGRVDMLGDDQVLKLLDIQRAGDIVTAVVQVNSSGFENVAELRPSFDAATGQQRDTPNFPGSRFMLALQGLEGDAVRLNIQAPGNSSQRDNVRTTVTLLASLLGFTGLFWWLYNLRRTLLGMRRQLDMREVA